MTAILVPVGPKQGLEQSWQKAVADGINLINNSLDAKLGSGSPTGTGVNGQEYWDTVGKRLYRSDGVGWIVMAEPRLTTGDPGAFAPNVVSSVGAFTTLGAVVFTYHREDGYLDYELGVSIITNGTAAGFIAFSLPVDSASQEMGVGREISVTGSMLNVNRQAVNTAFIVTYNNAYPGGTGFNLQVSGRYRMASRYS